MCVQYAHCFSYVKGCFILSIIGTTALCDSALTPPQALYAQGIHIPYKTPLQFSADSRV